MLTKIFAFIKTPTSKNILINTFGNYLNVIFTAFFAFILVRILNPTQYGTLSVLLGVAYVLANILDFGVSASIYSYLPLLLEKKTVKIYRFLKTTFFFQTIFACFVVVLLFVFFPLFDRFFLKTQAPWWELWLTTFSIIFLIWQNYAVNSLLAAKRVFESNLLLNLSNLLKTFLLFLLIYFGLANIATVIFTFGIFGPLIFFFFLFLRKSYVISQIAKAKINRKEFKFSYTFTYFLASQLFNLGTRMDLFLLSFYFPKSELLGYYGLSTKIILTLFAGVSSITQILSPQFAMIKNNRIKLILKKSIFYLSLPTFVFIILAFTPNQIFYLVFTEKFKETAQITKALAIAYLFYSLGNIPYLYFLYTVKKPLKILIANLIFFASVAIGCYFLIPQKNVFGPPMAIFFGLFLAIFYLILEMLADLRKINK